MTHEASQTIADADTEGSATLELLGTAAWAALIASLLGAVPGAVSASSAGASFPLAWVALVGGSALLLLPFCIALRIQLGRGAVGRRGLMVLVASLGLSAPVLSILLKLLKTGTHHRPLGAATFAGLALISLLGALAVVGRLGSFAGRDGAAGKRAALLLKVAVGVGALGLLYASLPLLGAGKGALLGALLLIGVSGALCWLGLPKVSGTLARVGVALCLLLSVMSGVLLRSGDLLETLQKQAPVSLGAGWLWG
ncbi:MAG: hypothetical protein H6718_08945 [Polyangiaceae bacterium]|nr:hypothetical protein [Myxococcales bacterium]MCB9585512.1 hypothetical protein [Polyangiaceae bacterium]MCB9606472.1 hypothetical protein [Polyangiaceae bacterium]